MDVAPQHVLPQPVLPQPVLIMDVAPQPLLVHLSTSTFVSSPEHRNAMLYNKHQIFTHFIIIFLENIYILRDNSECYSTTFVITLEHCTTPQGCIIEIKYSLILLFFFFFKKNIVS
jgi:hypothetical protein